MLAHNPLNSRTQGGWGIVHPMNQQTKQPLTKTSSHPSYSTNPFTSCGSTYTSHNFGFSPKSRFGCGSSASGGKIPAAICCSICRRNLRRMRKERRTIAHETKRRTNKVARNVRLLSGFPSIAKDMIYN